MTSRTHRPSTAVSALAFMAGLGAAAVPAQAAPEGKGAPDHDVRFATFNASLNRFNAGELTRDLSTGDNVQAQNVAETIQRTDADVILVNEFDYARR
ncbi:hypothetical protein [Ornithinimicrobium panacihumi]|uniref:hypothetical protein n=1 Tax=Ornithinimicrobium panacihumi TaxID=2008449 RepID=UPI003F8A94F5